ncbi:HD domain-containing phosphohydrolase [Paraburkholderia phenoliruptrix]|uniref:HD domain-containing phosphohydrolase n=1 Tax=Paraburkholderia phenoliruptrix TaxID=252970 RepID=UPI001C6E24A2|nr:HD domain-containing phosphohydrolase [Paraburkholderia phenoliruptrix]MBW9105469.1 LuxR family transcriptional regulator [Paraburkholderia phenoliruptrix]MBW9130037.1 LuxR family transcriptional regulator [Paraburkholderia ginsengiterrae]
MSTFNVDPNQTALRVFDSVRALAFVGDLSMGQPTDHSLRTGWLAARLARAAGLDSQVCDTVREVALLRWSGCTANASGFAEVFGDDIAVRLAMLEGRSDWAAPLEALGGAASVMLPLAQTHCEVSGEIASMSGLSSMTQTSLRHIFETWDGSGFPAKTAHASVPMPVFVVAVAGDLEIFSRTYGTERALELIEQRSNSRYPAHLVGTAVRNASGWLDEAGRATLDDFDAALITPDMQRTTSAELVADVIDLKLPWMTGFSRAVATTAAACCARLSLDQPAQIRVYQAALIHGIGRAAVPNAVWNQRGTLAASAWEKIRLVPYWTARAGRQTGALAEAAELASYAYERQDGSGYFRGAAGRALTLEARVLAASVVWVALRSPRPWRDALPADAARKILREEVERGRLSDEVVDALMDPAPAGKRSATRATQGARLSAREMDVLRMISRGASNKEAARELAMSPSTVRTHVESMFRKLDCSTRAAATLKASALGLL